MTRSPLPIIWLQWLFSRSILAPLNLFWFIGNHHSVSIEFGSDLRYLESEIGIDYDIKKHIHNSINGRYINIEDGKLLLYAIYGYYSSIINTVFDRFCHHLFYDNGRKRDFINFRWLIFIMFVCTIIFTTKRTLYGQPRTLAVKVWQGFEAILPLRQISECKPRTQIFAKCSRRKLFLVNALEYCKPILAVRLNDFFAHDYLRLFGRT